MRVALDYAQIAVRIRAPAAAVWRFFDWPNMALFYPAGQLRRVEYIEKSPVPGAVRELRFADGMQVSERLELYEPDVFHLVYRVIDTGSAPLAEYRGDLRITAAGPEACSVRLACEFTPLGAPAEEFVSFWKSLNHATLEFVRSRVESKPLQETR